MKVLLFALFALSAQAANYQEIKCTGHLTDDNGFGAGNTWVNVIIRNPSVRSLQKLTRAQAAARIQVSYPSSHTISVQSASVTNEDLAIATFTAVQRATVWIPTKWINKKGYFQGVQVDFATGGGTYVGKYSCRSSLGED